MYAAFETASEGIMQVVCILGSPKPEGNTAAVLSEIMRGLEKHGADISIYHLNQMHIAYCNGCKACYKNGACVIKDDVREIIGAVKSAQLVIVASPSYWGDVTAQLKTFIDRCTPYGNTNPARLPFPPGIKGAAVAVRAGAHAEENRHLVQTIAHFLSHLDIPLVAQFTAEGIETKEDLIKKPSVLRDAFIFGEKLSALIAQQDE